MQANRFIAIMDNFNRVQEINNELMGSAGTLTKGYETVLGSVAGKADRARASFEGMWVDAINSDAIGFFYDISFWLTEAIRSIGVFNVAIAGLIIALQLLHAQSVLKDGAFAKWTATLMANGTTMNALIVSTYEKIKADGLLTTVTESQTVANIKNGTAMKTLSVLLDVLRGKTSLATAGQLIFGKSGIIASGGIATLGTAIVGIIPLLIKFAVLTGGLTLITGGISLLFSKFTSGAKETTTSIGELNKAIGEHSNNVNTLKSVASEYSDLISKMGEGRDITKLSADEQERYNSIMNQVEQIAPNYIAYIGESNTKMLIYGKTLDDIIKKEEELIEIRKQDMIDSQVATAKDVENKEKELQKKQDKLQKELKNLEDNAWLEDTGGFNSKKSIEKINKLKSEIQSLGGELESLQAQQVQVLESLMSEFDNVANASESMKSIAKESVMELFETEGFDKAKDSIGDFKIVLEESTLMLRDTGLEFDYTEDASDRLKEAFVRLGMDEGDVVGFLQRLALKLGIVGDSADGVVAKLGFNMEELEGLQKAEQNISKMYETIVKGGQLTSEQMNQLIMDNEDIAKYVAETGDITLQNGELLRDVWVNINEEMQDFYNTNLQSNKKVISELEAQLESSTKRMKELSESNKEGSIQYKKLKENVDELTKSLAQNRASAEDNIQKLEALKRASQGGTQHQDVSVSIQGMEQAQQQLDSYRKIMDEIDKTGKLSAETNRRIIREHEELIGVIGDEVTMREIIQDKIKETEQIALDYYKNVLMQNESFYKKMLDSNSDMFDRIGKMYDINVSNFKNMAALMGKIAEITGQEISKAMSFTVKMSSDYNTQVSSSGSGAFSLLGEIQGKITSLENKAKSGKILSSSEQFLLSKYQQDLAIAQKEYANATDIQRDQISTNASLESLVERAGSANIGAITSAGGGGSKSTSGAKKGSSARTNEAREVDYIDLNTNAYLRWEQAILRVDEALERHELILERATGEDRVALIDKENNLLKEKQRLLNLTNQEYRRERDLIDSRLKKWGVNTQSSTGGVADFDRIVANRQKQLDIVTNQINAIKTDTKQREQLIAQRDDLKSGIDSLIDDFNRYIEVANKIEEHSTQWWEIQSQILDNQLERLESGLKKYGDRLEKINQQMELLGKIRESRPLELAEELKALQQISEVVKDRRGSLNQQLYESGQRVKQLEQSLAKMGSIRNEQYLALSRSLVAEREMYDSIMDKFMEATLDYNKAMNNIIDKRVEGLERERDAILKNIDALAELDFEYTFRNIYVDARDIQHQIDLINKKFREDVEVRLDTTDIQNDLDKIKDYFDGLKDVYDSFEDKMKLPEEDVEKITKLENAILSIESGEGFKEVAKSFGLVGETAEDITKQLKEMLESERFSIDQNKEKADILKDIAEEQAKQIKSNKEEAQRLKEEIEDLAYEYKEIEASLQNRINLKEEELRLLQEQFRREEKVRRQVEKQLELLRALDDTRYSYITGTGEEVFTYDVSAVNKLRKELDGIQRQDKQEKEVNALQEEIKKMKEELQRTREINQLEIAIRELQLKALEENTGALENLLDKSKEGIEGAFDNLADRVVDEFKKAFEPMVETWGRIWDEFLNRKSIDSVDSKFPHQSGNEYYAQTEKSVQKGTSINKFLEDNQVTWEELLALNKGLINKNGKFDKDMKVKVPPKNTGSFDTGGWYTGSFKGGMPAVLHEKELVLNKADTVNMLKTVDITRSMIRDLQVKPSSFGGYNKNKEKASQDVYIENVNLPSVKDGKSFVNDLHSFLRKGQNRLV